MLWKPTTCIFPASGGAGVGLSPSSSFSAQESPVLLAQVLISFVYNIFVCI